MNNFIKRLFLNGLVLTLLGAVVSSCRNPNKIPDNTSLVGISLGTVRTTPLIGWMQSKSQTIDTDDGTTTQTLYYFQALDPNQPSTTLQTFTFIDKGTGDYVLQTAGETISLRNQRNCFSGASQKRSIQLCLQANSQFTFQMTLDPRLKILPYYYQFSIGDLTLFDKKGALKLSVQALMKRAQFLSYSAQEQAEQVYQAKERIRVARGNLLPRLNLAVIGDIAIGGVPGIAETVGALLPFLSPSRWFQLKQSKILFEAERFSFAGLRGNEMSSIEQLAYAWLRDSQALTVVDREIATFHSLLQSLQVEEDNGVLAQGSSDYFNDEVIKLRLDRLQLSQFLTQEQKEITQAVRLSPLSSSLTIESVLPPALNQTLLVDPTLLFKDAERVSLELQALKKMELAASVGVKEAQFSYFDVLGSGGGFGTPAEIRIDRSQVRVLQDRQIEFRSLLELKAVEISSNVSIILDANSLLSERSGILDRRTKFLIQSHLQGTAGMPDDEYVRQLTALQKERVDVELQMVSAQYSYLMIQSRIRRLTLNGDYGTLFFAVPIAL